MKIMARMLVLILVSCSAIAGPKDYYIIQRNTQPLNSNYRLANINLMSWMRAGKPLPDPTEPYNREKHFGRWIDDSRDNNCLNTRAKVLVTNSQMPVTYTNANKCVVATGQWNDVYTGKVFKSAADIQIDHFIPLKQAYTTGAWKWDYHARCLYGNFIFNQYQLLAVSGHENMSKSDKAPDEYMPPNRQIWCPYIRNWLKIKLIWNLVMTPTEAEAIAKIYQLSACRAQDFVVPEAELAQQRALIQKNYNYCDYDTHRPMNRLIDFYD